MLVFAHSNTTNAGVAVRLPLNAVPGAIFYMDQWEEYTQARVVVTQIQMGKSGKVQLMDTFNNEIFLSVFGDGIGTMRISGIVFDRACSGDSERTAEDDRGGLRKLLDWYEANKVTATPSPISVVIASDVAFEAFVLAMSVSTLSAEQRTMSFSLNLAVIPSRGELK